MEVKIKVLIVLLFSGLLGFSQTNYYVSTTGDDLNLGTEAAPFKTIEKALNSFDAFGGTCYIMEGIYHESITTDGKNNITITSYNSANVILDGTVEITSGWIQDAGNPNIYVTALSQDIWQLFIDNEQQVIARWPNAQFSDESIYDRSSWAKRTKNGTTETHMQLDVTSGHRNLAASGVNAQGAMVIANVGNWKTWARTVTNHVTGPNVIETTLKENKYFVRI